LSEFHEWINSIGIVAALGVSGYFGWQSTLLRKESLLITSRATGACSVKVGAAESALCWSVIIANGSEDRLSIIQANWKRLLPSAAVVLGFDFATPDGKALSFPLNLDGGEGKQIMVRATILVTSDVADINRKIGEAQSHPQPLHDVQLQIASAGLDTLGNKVNPVKNGANVIGWRWESTYRSEVDLLTFSTGRGGTFSGTLAYPSPTDNWGPD